MRNIIRRLALTGSLVLAAASGVTVATADTASADGWGCSGNDVSGSPYAVATTTGAVYSYVHLFYDPSSGDNCAVNVKTGSLYGTPTLTKVKLSVCSDPAPTTSCSGWNLPSQEDPTNNSTLYAYYAGPVTVPGVGHCIAVYAETDRTASDFATYWSGAFHCG
ncbi:hypothetical protein [Kitasatospora kifunensis]|uniref:Spore-associated protein A n=1 Tax=Kitasatospora kifunensis TaxID=58351 RepID=A0A7W7W023_KITKI|nr:hypothetical protein [Kitasatospora kifunensis]MBB4928723.1 hypothetical protein [Kitasatospora kifunensis]